MTVMVHKKDQIATALWGVVLRFGGLEVCDLLKFGPHGSLVATTTTTTTDFEMPLARSRMLGVGPTLMDVF